MLISTQNKVAFPFAAIAREEPDAPGGAPADVTPAEPLPEPAPQDTPDPASEPTPQDTPDYSWVPEAFRGEDGSYDFEGFRTAYDDAQASLAAVNEERPEAPDGYEIALPEDFDYGDITAPEWFDFQIDPENPLVGELQSFLHENKLPAEAGKAAAGMMARYEARRAAQYAADRDAEMKALGPQVQARLDKIQRAVETRVANQAQRSALMDSMVSADAIRAIETLINGGAPTRTTMTQPNIAAKEGITAFERLTLANQQKTA